MTKCITTEANAWHSAIQQYVNFLCIQQYISPPYHLTLCFCFVHLRTRGLKQRGGCPALRRSPRQDGGVLAERSYWCQGSTENFDVIARLFDLDQVLENLVQHSAAARFGFEHGSRFEVWDCSVAFSPQRGERGRRGGDGRGGHAPVMPLSSDSEGSTGNQDPARSIRKKARGMPHEETQHTMSTHRYCCRIVRSLRSTSHHVVHTRITRYVRARPACFVSRLCPQDTPRRVLSLTVSLSPKRLARTYASQAATVFEITRCCPKFGGGGGGNRQTNKREKREKSRKSELTRETVWRTMKHG